MLRQIRTGLCGWTINQREYFERFPLVEVQHTFYDPPPLKTLLRWRETAPRDFEFTLKAWQLITHSPTSRTYARMKRVLDPSLLAECGSFRWSEGVLMGWNTTVECAKVLRATSVLFQCPASFRPEPANLDRLREFMTRIDRHGLRFLWEPRGHWPESILRELCHDLRLTHVVDPFVNETVTPAQIYYRLHGIGNHRYRYTAEDLQRLRDMVPVTAMESVVLFNNIPRDGDAARFQTLVGRSAASAAVR